MRRTWKSLTACGMAAALAVTSVGLLQTAPQVLAAETQAAADYQWTFDNVSGKNAANVGTVKAGDAVLQGTAKAEAVDIKIGDRTYSQAGNKVLILSGGAKGSSYADLPADIYKGVTAETGFTWSFWMKPDQEAENSYTRVISSATENGENEFAYAFHASDGVWNVIFDGAPDHKYSEIYSAEPQKGVWSLITFTVTEDDITLYINGEEVGSEVTAGEQTTELETRLNNMESLVKNALGKTSTGWGDPDCVVSLDDVSLYKRALTAKEVAEIANSYGFSIGTQEEPEVGDADYQWTFDNVSGKNAANVGTAGTGDAVLQGTAKALAADIKIGDRTYSQAGNKVLILSGGAKGSSYADLPADIYKGVTAETGFTWSFWMKPDQEAENSYTRVISSATENGENEFAYAFHASDGVWNVIFDGAPDHKYSEIYSAEPQKGVWSLITFTVTEDDITLYINGEEVGSEVTAGEQTTELETRLNNMESLVKNALGKTSTGWGDPDCAVSLDDVSLYKRALTAKEVAEIANSYGFSVSTQEKAELGGADELTDGTKVSPVEGLSVTSPDGTLETKIMTDSKTGRFFYTTAKNGVTILQASQLGLVTKDVDFTKDLVYVQGSAKTTEGTEEYKLTSGTKDQISDPYRNISFDLAKKGNEQQKITVTIRSFDGGIAYGYTLYGKAGEKVSISEEASEYVLPADADVWAGNTTDVNYEFDYTKRTMKSIKTASGNLPVPLLANDGDLWVLISEGGVYNDADPYCASYLSTQAGTRNLKLQFGNAQNGAVVKTYKADGSVSTPWRVAAIADNLNDIVNASIFTSVNPEPDKNLYADTSYIKPGRVAWSWWSESGDDPVEYDQQKDYIDFAAENGWEYVCIDFGWCLWDDYQTKVAELAKYAEAKGVGLMLWYGVNNDNHSGFKDAAGDAAYPKYSLKTTEQLEEQLAWCAKVGVKAVKVDYYEQDDQGTMRQMYECATIAAKNKINVLFHGCTVPKGEQRTFPNVLGYEAVRGGEWFKWNVGPSVASMLTYLFTRNVLGGMDFTPPAMKIAQWNTTAGFHLAQTVAYESGLPNYASSVYKLEGFNGLPLMNDIAVRWDETVLVDGYPGEYLTVARRSGDDWYLAAMTAEAKDETIDLSFLGDGTYNAYLFKDNADGSDIVIETAAVTKESGLPVKLLANGGISVKFTKKTMDLSTAYEDYTFYEAEDSANKLAGNASVVTNQFVSGMKRVGGLGGSKSSMLTFTNVTAPEDGVYEMRLYYSTGVERRICFSINGGDAIRTKKLNCGVNALSAESFYVELKKGTNTIAFFNNEAKAPDVDRIAISNAKTDQPATETDNTDDGLVPPEGAQYDYNEYGPNDAVLAGGARLENGAIGWLGGSADCTATYKVTVDQDGTYMLRICYFTGESRNLQIRVNDGEVITVNCPSTGSYTPDSAEYIYVKVNLKAGENTITLFNAAGWAPNIQGIGISTEMVKIDTPDQPDTPEKPGDQTGNGTQGGENNAQGGNATAGGAQTADSADIYVYGFLLIACGIAVTFAMNLRKRIHEEQ